MVFEPIIPSQLVELHAKLKAETDRIIADRNIQIENLTREQVAAAFQQAVLCGDFSRHVAITTLVDKFGQQVIYLPYSEKERLERRITQLKDTLYRHNITIPEE